MAQRTRTVTGVVKDSGVNLMSHAGIGGGIHAD